MSHLSSVLKGVVGLTALLSFASFGMQHAIMRDDTGFKVMDKGEWHQVHNYDVEPKLRNMSREHLKKFLAAGCLLQAKKLSNGDFALRTHVPGFGGGAGGAAAGVVIGHTLVWGICHGTAAIASVFGSPATGVVVETAISVGSPAIETVAMKVGLALGIFLGVATGPV